VTLAFALITVLVFSVFSSGVLFQRAFADGLTQENLPPATLGNRQASLFVKVNPPILTTSSKQDAFMQFRLFDANTNETVKYTTYNIEVTKGTADNGTSIMQGFFQAPNGLLTLKIEPQPGPLTIYGNQDPILNAYVADPGGTVNIRGPLLLDGGLYHFHIEIFGIDNPRNIFTEQDAPKFDSWLSVGDVSNETISYGGQNYNTTIISYYDKIHDFNFNPAKKTFTWSMPFDWNASRIKKNNIFVHEEVRIPKSLAGIGNASYFNATANGDTLTGRKLAIDPYSFQSEMTLHYLLNKDDILQMANNTGAAGGSDSSKRMSFSLAPASEAPAQTTGEMVTDTGGIGVAVQWSPSQLSATAANNNNSSNNNNASSPSAAGSTVKLRFSDAFSGTPLNADVQYGLNILDNTGKSVYSKDNLTAKGGTDTQTINFPSNEKYNIQVAVKGLINQGQQQQQQQVDKTRNGIARGIVIVPEFPTSTVLVMSVVIGALLIVNRVVRGRMIPSSGINLK
jgi:hypothetical protein